MTGWPAEGIAAFYGCRRICRRQSHRLKRPHREKGCERHGETMRGAAGVGHIHAICRGEDAAKLHARHGRIHRVRTAACGCNVISSLYERIGRYGARPYPPQQHGARAGTFTLHAEHPRSKDTCDTGGEMEIRPRLRSGRHGHVAFGRCKRPAVLVPDESAQNICALRHGLHELRSFAGKQHKRLRDLRKVAFQQHVSIGGEYLESFLHVQAPEWQVPISCSYLRLPTESLWRVCRRRGGRPRVHPSAWHAT